MKDIRLIAFLVPFVFESIFIVKGNEYFDMCLNIDTFTNHFDNELSECHKIIAIDNGNIISDKQFKPQAIGGGGFGSIFRCNLNNQGTEISVVMKKLVILKQDTEFIQNTKYDYTKELVHNEIVALDHGNTLNNPFLPLFFGCVYNPKKSNKFVEYVYIITEFLDDNLEHLEISTKNNTPLAEIVFTPQLDPFIKTLYQVSLAIQSLHNIGVGHFDIKPPNIMISEKYGIAKLIDFGFSSSVDLKVYNKFAENKDLKYVLFHNLKVRGSKGFYIKSRRKNDLLDLVDDLYSFGKTIEKLLDIQLGLKDFKQENYETEINALKDLKNDMITYEPKHFKYIKDVVFELKTILESVLVKNANNILNNNFNDNEDLRNKMKLRIDNIRNAKTLQGFLEIYTAMINDGLKEIESIKSLKDTYSFMLENEKFAKDYYTSLKDVITCVFFKFSPKSNYQYSTKSLIYIMNRYQLLDYTAKINQYDDIKLPPEMEPNATNFHSYAGLKAGNIKQKYGHKLKLKI